MAYQATDWKDHVVDQTSGKVIQQGTPVSASNMNKIEQGIADAHSKLEGAERQTQVLQHGLSVLNGDVGAPVSLQIEGRTLAPMQNTVLDPQKYYVLADKKAKIKFSDGTILSGVNKFTARAEKPIIIRAANYENKVAGSTLENPHIAHSGKDTTLLPPSSFTNEQTTSDYVNSSKLDGTLKTISTALKDSMSQDKRSFNIIEEVERNVGRIPRTSVADKVAWLKANIAKITCNWWGYGSSPNGNKASFTVFLASSNMWWTATDSSHTNSTVTKLTRIPGSMYDLISSDGYVHCIAYADPSDGVTPSTIYTDYVELVIELKSDAVLHEPRVPLYEVTKEAYDKILVSLLEDEVLRRYPSVEGVKHIQNPYVMAEGDNLIPPFYEWTVIPTTVSIISPYEVTHNALGVEYLYVDIPIVPGNTYNFSAVKTGPNSTMYIDWRDKDKNLISTTGTVGVIAPINAVYARLVFKSNSSGLSTYKNPIMNLGPTPKPFVPRNPSYLYAGTKLGQIGDKKDILFEQDGKYFKRKYNELDVVLDGIEVNFSVYYTGMKRFVIPSITNGVVNFNSISNTVITKYDGKMLRFDGNYSNSDVFSIVGNGFYFTVSNTDTGFADSYAPTSDEIKAYFNGWQVKTADGTGKPTAWKSIVDGTDAPTQTLAYVSTNKAANYTPYKLSYVLANPVTEEIKVEGTISVNGLTQAEVGSGVIFREKAKVFTTATNAYINRYDGVYGASILNNKALKIMNVYKNGVLDNHNWTWGAGSSGYGKDYLWTEIKKYDPTEEYTVTYLIYDREKLTANITTAQATYANNIRTALEDTVKKVEDNTTSLTVQANILYDVLKRLKAGGM